MSRSHVANMHSISTPPGTPLSTPRIAPSPPHNTPGHVTPLGFNNDRDRPRDSGVQAIGAFFATPYDSDAESDFDELPTPAQSAATIPNPPIGRNPVARARTGDVSVNVVNTPKGYKNALEAKIRSQAGELDGNWSEEDDEEENYDGRRQYEHQEQLKEVQLQPPSPVKGRQSDESGRVRPLTVVEFPEPSLQPEQGHGRGYPQSPAHGDATRDHGENGIGLGLTHTQPLRPAGPVRSHSDDHNGSTHALGHPRTPPRTNTAPLQPRFNSAQSQYPPSIQVLPPHPQPHAQNHNARPQPRLNTSLSPPRTIALPPPSSPISPLLAAPPKPHFSPLSPPSSPFAKPSSNGRPDSTNGSIRGFDAMAEKKAFFREGQEELMSPFSTRRTERKRAGRANTKSAIMLSGMDFWKRFSVHVKLDEAEKAQAKAGDANGSAWLNKAQEQRSRIKKIIWAFLVLVS
ncbi:hypothetical protein I316_00551 [Kwoniella heveanensis BCC8398]|uniref:Uncharacterized protein n=1 Tax=Kwoniella heveanensis BCC8398 TaxID=1296120 RepID=A0A1B9H2D4_9TREE|nr:hypothetical protein I316_00551 [Kwoniella heveanensis BCC8398]